MQSISFTCETITPMFLSGADGQTPELHGGFGAYLNKLKIFFTLVETAN